MRRLAAAVALALGVAAPAWAQTALSAPPPSSFSFLPRTDASFLWSGLVNGDPRFAYDGRLRADADVVRVDALTLGFVVDYEAIIGHERRTFDLNQGTYVLEGSAAYRVGRLEISAVFHHVSRHLVDRENPSAISWNEVGGRLARQTSFAGSTLESSFDLSRVTRPAFVDYVWTTNVHFVVRRPIDARFGFFGKAGGGLIGVDPSIALRERQCGSAFEGGLRVNGATAAMEFFAGYERRIDGYPTDRTRERFFSFGFRLTTR